MEIGRRRVVGIAATHVEIVKSKLKGNGVEDIVTEEKKIRDKRSAITIAHAISSSKLKWNGKTWLTAIFSHLPNAIFS
jgi:hypothetical protein